MTWNLFFSGSFLAEMKMVGRATLLFFHNWRFRSLCKRFAKYSAFKFVQDLMGWRLLLCASECLRCRRQCDFVVRCGWLWTRSYNKSKKQGWKICERVVGRSWEIVRSMKLLYTYNLYCSITNVLVGKHFEIFIWDMYGWSGDAHTIVFLSLIQNGLDSSSCYSKSFWMSIALLLFCMQSIDLDVQRSSIVQTDCAFSDDSSRSLHTWGTGWLDQGVGAITNYNSQQSGDRR